MALSANEVYKNGFVRDVTTGQLVTTPTTAGATMQDGFMRDADGRLLVVAI